MGKKVDQYQQLQFGGKNVFFSFLSTSNAANVVVALILGLAIIFALSERIDIFFPLVVISVLVFLLLLAFKPDTLRDNKYTLAIKRMEIQLGEKSRMLPEAEEAILVQPETQIKKIASKANIINKDIENSKKPKFK